MSETTVKTPPEDTWAIVELFGHKRLAGKVSEHTMGGSAFVRLDVPKPDDPTAFHTHLYGQGAIYGIHFVEESLARHVAGRSNDQPFSVWDLPERARLALLDDEADADIEDIDAA